MAPVFFYDVVVIADIAAEVHRGSKIRHLAGDLNDLTELMTQRTVTLSAVSQNSGGLQTDTFYDWC